jgi:3-hydroxybutyryl-CoA dehydrogenase
MGSGIAQVSAAAGYKTIVREVDEAFLRKGLARIRTFLDEGVSRGKVTAESRDATLGRLAGTTSLDELSACDLIIEAITESLDEKRATYAALEPALSERTILISNTSSLCITELAAATRRADRFAGLHFFNPVPLMKFVDQRRHLSDHLQLRAVARQRAGHCA